MEEKVIVDFKHYTVENGTGRVIPYDVMKEALLEFEKNVKENLVIGELDHPGNMTISLENVSHKITSFEMKDGLSCEIGLDILNTPMGQIANMISTSGVELIVDPRMYGNEEKIDIVTFDLIKKPE